MRNVKEDIGRNLIMLKVVNNNMKLTTAIIYFIIMGIVLVGCASTSADEMAMSNTQISGHGSTIMYKDSHDMTVTSGKSFNSNVGKTSMMSIGYSTLDVNKSLYAQNFNAVDSSMTAEFSKTAVISDSYGMEQQIGGITDPTLASISNVEPSYQYATAGGTQIGFSGGRYESGAIINNANITVSARVEGNGGSIVFDKYAQAKNSFSADGSSGDNYAKEERTRFYAAGDGVNHSYSGDLDFEWKDHSNVIKATNESIAIVGNITNESIDVNETVSNETVEINMTEEANGN